MDVPEPKYSRLSLAAEFISVFFPFEMTHFITAARDADAARQEAGDD